MRRIGKLLVITRGKVNAERRRKLLERRHQLVEVAFGAVEKIAGEKDYVGLEGLCLRHETAAESHAIDGSEVQIAQQHRTPPTPGRRKIRQLHRDAADANDAGVDETVEADDRGHAVEGDGKKWTKDDRIRIHCQPCESSHGPRDPDSERRPEKEVE